MNLFWSLESVLAAQRFFRWDVSLLYIYIFFLIKNKRCIGYTKMGRINFRDISGTAHPPPKLAEKWQIQSMADHVRFNPFLRLWLPDYYYRGSLINIPLIRVVTLVILSFHFLNQNNNLAFLRLWRAAAWMRSIWHVTVLSASLPVSKGELWSVNVDRPLLIISNRSTEAAFDRTTNSVCLVSWYLFKHSLWSFFLMTHFTLSLSLSHTQTHGLFLSHIC